MFRITLGSLIACLAASNVAQAELSWEPGKGGTCATACIAAGKNPVASGVFANGRPFYICRANVDNRGARPGFNAEPDWSQACWVANGAGAAHPAQYDCLCQ